MNCHHKCQKHVPNLCGINQKAMAEALGQAAVSFFLFFTLLNTHYSAWFTISLFFSGGQRT